VELVVPLVPAPAQTQQSDPPEIPMLTMLAIRGDSVEMQKYLNTEEGQAQLADREIVAATIMATIAGGNACAMVLEKAITKQKAGGRKKKLSKKRKSKKRKSSKKKKRTRRKSSKKKKRTRRKRR